MADGDDITPAAEPAAARVPDPGAGERDPEGRALLRAGESVLFIDSKEREYLKTLRAGGRFSLRGGAMAADDIIGTHEGRMVRNPQGEDFLMLRPTFAQLIPNLPRRAQVIYPKDIALILLWGDIGPGMHVLEAGTGPGALTMALLRAVGPTGTRHVVRDPPRVHRDGPRQHRAVLRRRAELDGGRMRRAGGPAAARPRPHRARPAGAVVGAGGGGRGATAGRRPRSSMCRRCCK